MRGSPARTYEADRACVFQPGHQPHSLYATRMRAGISGDAPLHAELDAQVDVQLRAQVRAWCPARVRPRICFQTSWAVAGHLAVLGIALSLLAVPAKGLAAEPSRCLGGDEQRAAILNGKTVPIATVIHSLRRAPKDVIKAQLCQEPERLVYMLTLLGRDGKVKRAIVDATNGAVVGER